MTDPEPAVRVRAFVAGPGVDDPAQRAADSGAEVQSGIVGDGLGGLAGRVDFCDWGWRDSEGLMEPGEVDLMVDVGLGQEGDVVFVDGTGEALAGVEVEGGPRVALHNGVDDGAEEVHWGEIVCVAGLGDDAEADGGAALVVGVLRGRAKSCELEAGEFGGIR